MISIITVNWNSYDFLALLVESLAIYSTVKYELIVIDNSILKQDIVELNVSQHLMSENTGHGPGLNYGVNFAQYEFVMFLDVDTHILCKNWHEPFIEMMNHYDVIGGRGVPAKPIRPACMFMKKDISKLYDWRATEGYKGHRLTPEGYDVAIAAFYKMQQDGLKIGFLEAAQNRYKTHTGEEWCIDGKSLVYHHWSGTWLKKRQEDFPDINLFDEKYKLFSKIPWRIL